MSSVTGSALFRVSNRTDGASSGVPHLLSAESQNWQAVLATFIHTTTGAVPEGPHSQHSQCEINEVHLRG